MLIEDKLNERIVEDAKRFAYLADLCKLDHGSKLVDIGTSMLFTGGAEDLRKLVDEERGL